MTNSTKLNSYAQKALTNTIQKMDGAYADSTIRAYKDDFGAFIKYCSGHNLPSLPADPQAICSYIRQLVDDGRTSASIRRMLSGITTIHKLNRYPDPTKDPDVLLEMRRMHRKIGRYSKQALGITSDILEKLITASEAGNRGARDRALLLIAYDSLCRRSELASLLIEDIKYLEVNNTANSSILIRKSKTDQFGQGRRLALSARATTALIEWLARRGNPKRGQLFMGVNRAQKIMNSFCAAQINRIYKRLAERAGLSRDMIDHISGHSLRVGHAQDMVNSGESLPMILSNHPRLAPSLKKQVLTHGTSGHESFKPDYDKIVWESGAKAQRLFKAWCEGKTGYPLVDAAMHQLNQSGYMHNRLRMVVACFLIKDLGIDWPWGEQYFADHLSDFDFAANNGGWQWASSSGCDAQPYFRIFNPITQSEKFD